mgnify:CR=1 FL=1
MFIEASQYYVSFINFEYLCVPKENPMEKHEIIDENNNDSDNDNANNKNNKE